MGLLIALGIVGLVGGLIAGVGSIISGYEQAEELEQQAERTEDLLDSGYYGEEQAALGETLADIEADEEAAATLLDQQVEELEASISLYEEQAAQSWEEFEVTQQELLTKQKEYELAAEGAVLEAKSKQLEATGKSVQALGVAQEGAQAKGQQAAAAGAGNIGGASVLRRASDIQRKVQRQTSYLSAQGKVMRESAALSTKQAGLYGEYAALVPEKIELERGRAQIEAQAYLNAAEAARHGIVTAELSYEDQLRALGIKEHETKMAKIKSELEETWAAEDILDYRDDAQSAILSGWLSGVGNALGGAAGAMGTWSRIGTPSTSLLTGGIGGDSMFTEY